jgi:DNA-binding transcriptional ArsR family regulator
MPERQGVREIELADRVFAALAHPARRQILLSVHFRGTCNAGDIARRFECSWPTTSRHLSTLVESGLLEMQRRGRERVYSANSDLLHGLLQQWSEYFRKPLPAEDGTEQMDGAAPSARRRLHPRRA